MKSENPAGCEVLTERLSAASGEGGVCDSWVLSCPVQTVKCAQRGKLKRAFGHLVRKAPVPHLPFDCFLKGLHPVGAHETLFSPKGNDCVAVEHQHGSSPGKAEGPKRRHPRCGHRRCREADPSRVRLELGGDRGAHQSVDVLSDLFRRSGVGERLGRCHHLYPLFIPHGLSVNVCILTFLVMFVK